MGTITPIHQVPATISLLPNAAPASAVPDEAAADPEAVEVSPSNERSSVPDGGMY